MNISERIKKYTAYKDIKTRRFEILCGLSNGYVRNINENIGADKLESILKTFPDLNRDWLLYGEGEMLKSEAEEQSTECSTKSGKLIPFYDIEAAAGTHYEMNMDTARQSGMIEIGSVLHDSESAIRVYGNSMIPNYPAGCVIGLKLHTDSFIEPGRVYVVETRDNRYLKRLYYNDDKSCLHCLSDNQMKYEEGPRKGKLYYQDFEIPFDEIVRLHQVVGVVKRNIL